MSVFHLTLTYILVTNIIGFAFMGIDKWKARRGAFRISEATLFTIALIGGSIGSIIGMYVFRHKTKHPAFFIGMPIILVIQVVIIVLIVKSGINIIIM